mgnify:CR=1 FL=1
MHVRMLAVVKANIEWWRFVLSDAAKMFVSSLVDQFATHTLSKQLTASSLKSPE